MAWLDKVPPVAKNVSEDRNHAIGFMPWFFFELCAMGFVVCLVAGKVVCVQDHHHPPTGLIAYRCPLAVIAGLGEQEVAAFSC